MLTRIATTLFLLLWVVLWIPSCVKAPKVKMTKSLSIRIDTLVDQQKDSIYTILTKECDSQYERTLARLEDSLLIEYLKEIETLTKIQ
jgi:hypothetical protein